VRTVFSVEERIEELLNEIFSLQLNLDTFDAKFPKATVICFLYLIVLKGGSLY